MFSGGVGAYRREPGEATRGRETLCKWGECREQFGRGSRGEL